MLRYRSECILFLVSLLFSGSFTHVIAQATQNSGLLKYELNDVFVGSMSHTIRIDNPESATVRGSLHVPLVRNETARHSVVISNFTSTIGQPKLVVDDSENLYAVWNNIAINRNARLTVVINYVLLSFATRYLINASYSPHYDTNSNIYHRYTQPEPLIQSDSPEIIQKAQNLTSGLSATSERVSRIYEFVVGHLRYVAQEGERGALWALRNGVGDCSEYSYLFIALCRASGIPARAKAGFAFHYDSETTEDGHMWAEYHLGDYGWVPVDATWRLFGKIDCRHFSSLQSILEEIPYANYVFNSTSGFAVEEKQTVTLRSASFDVFPDAFLAANLAAAVRETRLARLARFFAAILGSTWMFPAEAEDTGRSLRECSALLQEAVEQLEAAPARECVEKAQGIAQKTLTTIIMILVFYAGSALLIAVAVLAVNARRQSSKKAKTI